MNSDEITQSLSPIERKIIPFLEEGSIESITQKSGLDRVSVLRALEFLANKGVLSLEIKKRRMIDLGINGVYYSKKGLPERQLILAIEKGPVSMQDATKVTKLTQNEFKAALGALKKKALIDIKNGKILFNGTKEEISKKSLEEKFLEALPKNFDELSPEEKFAFNSLKERKDIILVKDEQIVNFSLNDMARKLMKEDLNQFEDLIEEVNPQMLRTGSWKGKKFRRYNVDSNVPSIYGGKKHFVNQSIDYCRGIWRDLGFKEMKGDLIQSSFWNFDALFTAQDHPVREMQDTFFLGQNTEIEDKKLVKTIKDNHEKGVDSSKGWRYSWKEEEAKKLVLRTHTTCLSARTLYELSKLPADKRKGKFFSIGKNFRNETVDWSHGFEFYQTEGIVVDPDVNFRHLLGYLTEFYKKMGFTKVKFAPAYFPYTEPSVEASVWHPEKKQWLELGGAGVFRPEITIPLLGLKTPVLAWGQGFDRIIMDYYKIKDLRELYKNDIKQLREIKFWTK